MSSETGAHSIRVLHLNSMLTGGGTDDRSVKIAHQLARKGCNLWMAGPAGREFSVVAQQLGIPFRQLPLGVLKLPFIFHTARLIRQEQVNVIHARHGRDYWPAILAARLSTRTPRIILSRHLAKSPGSLMSRHFLLSQCDALLACSHFVRKVLVEGVYEPNSRNPERRSRPHLSGNHSKIQVVYGGIDVNKFQPAPADDQRNAWGLASSDYAFGVAGGYTLPRGKGQREFLEAAAGIQHDFPRARFLIIGRGNLRQTLEADIQRLGLQGRAWLTPWCSDMPKAMNALDCLVHPQVGTESWGSVVCEAHACGKPVIASKLDGIPEAFSAAAIGELIEPDSVDALESAMRRWAQHPAIDPAAQHIMHSKVAERFSLEKAASNLMSAYKLVLGIREPTEV